MTGAEAIYMPMILGAAAGAGTAAARGQSAQGIALSGLAGGATGGIGGWAAGPAVSGATGAGAGGAGGYATGAGVGPLLSYGALPSILGTGTAAGALGTNLGAAGVTGPLLAEYGAAYGAGASPAWGTLGKQAVSQFTKPLLEEALKEHPRARVVHAPYQMQGGEIAIEPVQVQAIPVSSSAGISQDILRRYLDSLRRV